MIPGKTLEQLSSYPLVLTTDNWPLSFGGGERIRTDDPLRAKQALFQLSYTPDSLSGGPSWN